MSSEWEQKKNKATSTPFRIGKRLFIFAQKRKINTRESISLIVLTLTRLSQLHMQRQTRWKLNFWCTENNKIFKVSKMIKLKAIFRKCLKLKFEILFVSVPNSPQVEKFKLFGVGLLNIVCSMTRLGNFLHFGQLFKSFGNNYFAQISHILKQFL